MEFIIEGETINCVRVYTDQTSGEEARTVIASFDAQVDRVAPHVAAGLSSEEIKELELWLNDRAELQADLEQKPVEHTILETLPAIIMQAAEALGKAEKIDHITDQKIRTSIASLEEALDKAQSMPGNNQLELDEMQSSEELKDRLDAIKSNLGEK
ncbi:hypothetical protein [Oceanospirillum sediminis]|uniref:Uncharacterized protein n=1 Tax=Oceanospirillum sediminis TaxID=2760088 RepID=A0A839IV42_9GAMM|nr:hypothetical protein [Oceanospirillum sediminis]MBB1488572.1 hypothetical protein [Oceanospirillum sediminis]